MKISVVILLAQLLGLATSIHALMATRTAQGTIAWIVSLNTIPYVAVPAYWVFGRDRFLGYEKLHQENVGEAEQSLAQELENLRRFQTHGLQPAHRFQALEEIARVPFLNGNQAELLIDGDQTFESIYEGMEAAQDYLLVQFYIVRNDDKGREFQRRLIERAQAGVKVYLLLDEIGSIKLPGSYLDELAEHGVEVSLFNSTRGWTNKFQLNFRNHRKIVVADGRQGWLGGFNVGDEYREPDWRDTHMRFEGPAAMHLQLSFLEDWRWATGELLELSWDTEPTPEPNMPILILPTGPADRFETGSLMIQQVAHLAEERLWIASPYFVPDEGVVGALKLAALGGVDVRLLIPEDSDTLLTTLAVNVFVDSMLESGVRIFRYQPGMMHSKFFLFDQHGAAVSTVNLDNRSLRLNFEVTALALDAEFNRKVADMFEDDFANSVEMERGHFSNKPFWYRVAARAAYLFAPVL